MARILLGWELGANRGHVSRLLPIAAALGDAGHEVAIAVQNIGMIPTDRIAGLTLLQAPVWPRLLSNDIAAPGPATASMGDILVRLGLDRAESLPALVAAWHNLFAAFRPDLAIGDFAPAMGLAARGRMPVIAIGNGFALPPPDMPRFPVLLGSAAVHDEAETLARANAGLAAIGEPELGGLPGLFACDLALVGDFAPLDPYADWRRGGYSSPSVSIPPPTIAPAGGDEVFVYGFARAMQGTLLWDGLAAAGLPVRVYAPDMPGALAQALSEKGFHVEPAPLPFAEIARRSRILVSHGGHGFVCSGLLAGLPQVVTHYDLEKRLTGEALAAAGLGGHVALGAIRTEAFAASLQTLYRADMAQADCRRRASEFQAMVGAGIVTETLAAVDALIG